MNPLRLVTALAAALAAFAAAPVLHAQPQPIVPPTQAEKVEPSPDSDAADVSMLNAELFYEVLLGEINSADGDRSAGFALLLDAARKANDPDLYRRAADVALRARSGDAALLATRAWQEAFPTSREANRYVLQILVALNRVGETAVPLARELALTEPRTRALAYTAIPPLYARVGDKRAALAVVERVLADDLEKPARPEDGASAWVTVGRMRLAVNDTAGTLDAASRAQTLEPTGEGPAILALELMDPKQPLAEPIVKRYLASGKVQPEIRLGYARALADAQRNAEATRELQTLTVENADFPEGWLLRGAQEAQDGQFAAAEQSIKTFLDLVASRTAPTRPDENQARSLAQAYLVMAEIAEKRGDLKAAAAWLDKIDSPQALLGVQSRKASLLARQGRFEEGRALIRAVPERSAADKRGKLMAEVQLLRDFKREDEAYKLLQDASAAAPDDADLLYDLAMTAEKLGRLDDMERMLRQLIKQQPDYHHAYNALGYSFAERNVRLPEARDLIKKALEFVPNDPFITDSLGWVEFRMGNQEEAARLLQGAYKTKPDAEIAAHLGEVLWSMGQREQANAIWNEGLLINADNPTLTQTLKRLRAKP